MTHAGSTPCRGLRLPSAKSVLLAAALWCPIGAASAQSTGGPAPGVGGTPTGSIAARGAESKPYDEKLLRLVEILGAVHYLRELCGQNDGQQWRDRMREILDSDGGSALRRAMLTRNFNNGYRSYGRTYQSCTPTAQTAIARFLAEGAQLSDGLAKSVP